MAAIWRPVAQHKSRFRPSGW